MARKWGGSRAASTDLALQVCTQLRDGGGGFGGAAGGQNQVQGLAAGPRAEEGVDQPLAGTISKATVYRGGDLLANEGLQTGWEAELRKGN